MSLVLSVWSLSLKVKSLLTSLRTAGANFDPYRHLLPLKIFGGTWPDLAPPLITKTHKPRDLRSFEIRIGRFRFKSDVLIQNFRDSKFDIFESAAAAIVAQTTLTVQQKSFNCCVIVIEIYFMFMILCLCSKSIHTR